MKKTAFITGATSGIGRATALLLGQNGFRIIATGRRQERLEELKKELSKQTEIYTLNFDVRDQKAVLNAIDSLPEDWKNIDLLVNNAGNAHGLA
jgi:NADP-dependent 3-hydroxy acid dehydrogenase YdfG